MFIGSAIYSSVLITVLLNFYIFISNSFVSNPVYYRILLTLSGERQHIFTDGRIYDAGDKLVKGV